MLLLNVFFKYQCVSKFRDGRVSTLRDITMENGNTEETKSVVEEVPPKPSLIDKLKAKRWTFKLKNNFTEYITVEPLICFYMIQIFVVSLIEPYHFHKVFVLQCSKLNVDLDNILFAGLC